MEMKPDGNLNQPINGINPHVCKSTNDERNHSKLQKLLFLIFLIKTIDDDGGLFFVVVVRNPTWFEILELKTKDFSKF